MLSHKLEDEECPIAYASHSLALAENYSRIDREVLATVFGARHIHSVCIAVKP